VNSGKERLKERRTGEGANKNIRTISQSTHPILQLSTTQEKHLSTAVRFTFSVMYSSEREVQRTYKAGDLHITGK